MLNKVELLRIFCTAAQCDSFKAAAVRLHISPQAVTRAVQQLEQNTGEVLFHRSTRHIKLTRFAEEFLQQAQASLAQLDALFQKRQADREHVIAGLVRVAAPKGATTCIDAGIYSAWRNVIRHYSWICVFLIKLPM